MYITGFIIIIIIIIVRVQYSRVVVEMEWIASVSCSLRPLYFGGRQANEGHGPTPLNPPLV